MLTTLNQILLGHFMLQSFVSFVANTTVRTHGDPVPPFFLLLLTTKDHPKAVKVNIIKCNRKSHQIEVSYITASVLCLKQ